MNSTGQIMEFLGNLLKLVAWGNLRVDLQSLIQGGEPKRVAQEFVAWVNNGCSLSLVIPGKLKIDRSVAFVPGSQRLHDQWTDGWAVWRGGDGLVGEEEQDKRSLKVEEIDFSTVEFVRTERNDTETLEHGLQRLRASGKILMDARVAKVMLVEPGQLTLATLRARGISRFDIGGTTLRGPDGRRYILSLCYFDNMGWCQLPQDLSHPNFGGQWPCLANTASSG